MICRSSISPHTPVENESREKGKTLYNIFYIIGVIVVVLFILGYLGLR